MKKNKILFISHSYPPTLGGVESQNYNLFQGLKKLTPTKIIANGKGKKWLPFFIPFAFLKAFFLMTKYDVCILGNGVLAPLGAVLKFFHPKKKFFCIIHGLDITYASKQGFLPGVYKNINIPSLNRLNKLFVVSNASIEEAVNVAVKRELCVFIPNGVTPADLKEVHNRKELSNLFGKNVQDKKVILRLARFVPHKGTAWFIENVMPKLPENVVMIATGYRVSKNTAGDKDNFIDCEQAIIENKLESRVKLLPTLPQKDLKVLLNTVDMVVAPNIKHPGTMEGFGINVLEAAACERVVLASDIEGLADAVRNGENGFLVEPENVEKWVKKIKAVLDSGDQFLTQFGQKAEAYTQVHFSWENICKKYLEEVNT